MSVYVHGDNLEQKENHPTKYRDDVSKQYLKEIQFILMLYGICFPQLGSIYQLIGMEKLQME